MTNDIQTHKGLIDTSTDAANTAAEANAVIHHKLTHIV